MFLLVQFGPWWGSFVVGILVCKGLSFLVVVFLQVLVWGGGRQLQVS